MLKFEWDEGKRKANQEKHKVDLVYLARLFDESADLEVWNDNREPSEHRQIAIGRIDNEWFEVVFTMRGDVVRLISGWKLNEESKRKAKARHARRNQRDD